MQGSREISLSSGVLVCGWCTRRVFLSVAMEEAYLLVRFAWAVEDCLWWCWKSIISSASGAYWWMSEKPVRLFWWMLQCFIVFCTLEEMICHMALLAIWFENSSRHFIFNFASTNKFKIAKQQLCWLVACR